MKLTAAPTTLADLVDGDAACFAVSVNGEEVLVQPQITVNGVPKGLTTVIPRGQHRNNPCSDRGRASSPEVCSSTAPCFTVNGEERPLKPPVKLIINGEAAPYTKTSAQGWRSPVENPRSPWEALPRAATAPISIKVNGESLQLTPTVTGILVNGRPNPLIT